MEIRCGNCNKLFRIADEKIKGKGVKFVCTRCGKEVRITIEEFKAYTLTRATVSALGMPDVKPEPASVLKSEAALAAESAAAQSAAASEPAKPEITAKESAPKEPEQFDLSPKPAPDLFHEREESAAPDPSFFEETLFQEGPQLSQEREAKPQPQAEKARPELSRYAAPAVTPESPLETKPETQAATEPEQERNEQKSEPPAEPIQAPLTEQKAEPMSGSAAQTVAEQKTKVEPVPAAESPSTPPVRPATPRKEPAPVAVAYTAPKSVIDATPAAQPRSLRTVMILVIALLVLGLGGVGAFLYFRSSARPQQTASEAVVSPEGLRVINPSGSIEANGDLLVSGSVENTTDKPQPVWLIAVDVYDARGAVIRNIKLLNGRQLFTRMDYDVLAKRGVNVEELKTKTLHDRGVVIPPKGTIPFEAHYLQPPIGIASFNATLQPVDPAKVLEQAAKE